MPAAPARLVSVQPTAAGPIYVGPEGKPPIGRWIGTPSGPRWQKAGGGFAKPPPEALAFKPVAEGRTFRPGPGETPPDPRAAARDWWNDKVRDLIASGRIDPDPATLGDLRLRFRSGERLTRFTPDSFAAFITEDEYEEARDAFLADLDEVDFVLDRNGQDEELDFEATDFAALWGRE